jgi:hypothetical protein
MHCQMPFAPSPSSRADAAQANPHDESATKDWWSREDGKQRAFSFNCSAASKDDVGGLKKRASAVSDAAKISARDHSGDFVLFN